MQNCFSCSCCFVQPCNPFLRYRSPPFLPFACGRASLSAESVLPTMTLSSLRLQSVVGSARLRRTIRCCASSACSGKDCPNQGRRGRGFCPPVFALWRKHKNSAYALQLYTIMVHLLFPYPLYAPSWFKYHPSWRAVHRADLIYHRLPALQVMHLRS